MFQIRPAALVLASALLNACGPSTTERIIPAYGAALPEAVREPAHRKSWMSPAARGAPLLYVSNSTGVTVYSNPGGDTFKLVGELFGFQTAAGECTDNSGDVFIADETARVIDEYAHGAVTPKAVISDTLGQPLGCAIDRRTGRLAVTNFSNPSGGEPGNVALYASPSGSATEYTSSTLYIPLFCNFDRKGNLYVDGYNSGYQGELEELPNGAAGITTFAVSGGTLHIPAGLLVNGAQLLLGDISGSVSRIYEVSVSGTTATIAGTIPLSRTNEIAQFSLFGSASATAILAPDNASKTLEIYSFPSGTVLGSISDGISYSVGTAISP